MEEPRWVGSAKKAMEVTTIHDDASSDENRKRSSTPHSVTNTKRPMGKRAAKEMRGKKAGDDDIAKAMEAMASARKEANEDRKKARSLEAEAEARRTMVEERRIALEEKKVAMEEHQRLVEEERQLFLIDTSKLDERQREYINLARDEV